jgi:GT2 family glycosyltransferase
VTPPPPVSIVIVNYRSYGELGGCLASLEADARGGAEVVVVDHAGEAEATATLASRFPWAAIHRVDANAGFAAGVNRGAALTRGRYLLLVNPDTIARPGLCAALAGWLDAHPRVAVVGPTVRNGDGTVQATARRFPDPTTALAGRSTWLTRRFPRNWLSRRNLVRDAASPVEVDWVSGACMMIRRDAFAAVGGMDEGFFLYWEDADLCKRLAAAGWTTIYCPHAEVVHAGGRSSVHATRRAQIAFHDSVYRYYVKHGGALARLAAPLVRLGLRLRLALRLAQLRRQGALDDS